MFRRVFLSLTFAFLVHPAHAVEVAWAMPASACTPVQTAANSYKVTVGSVQHAGSNTGLLVLNCPVTSVKGNNDVYSLHINYRDSTGSGTGAFVRARLWRYSNVGDPTPEIVASVNSNASNIKADNNVSAPFEHTFNFDEGIYWIRVELDRANANQTVILYSVSLPVP